MWTRRGASYGRLGTAHKDCGETCTVLLSFSAYISSPFRALRLWVH